VLSEPSSLEVFRASAPPGTRLLTEAELQASLDQILRSHPAHEDVHVFGYGSLMWNPVFHFSDSFTAMVWGWSRKFCISLQMARGSPERPGVMLALDRGGACRGMVFRIPHASARTELMLLWRREMLAGAYQARWVTARSPGSTLRVLTFVANRQHHRYLPKLTSGEVAHLISNGAGNLGTCQAYFETTVGTLDRLGIRDSGIERIRAAMSLRNSRN
jgi:cation transport protein ChaC